jgi:hypothetical protein
MGMYMTSRNGLQSIQEDLAQLSDYVELTDRKHLIHSMEEMQMLFVSSSNIVSVFLVTNRAKELLLYEARISHDFKIHH